MIFFLKMEALISAVPFSLKKCFENDKMKIADSEYDTRKKYENDLFRLKCVCLMRILYIKPQINLRLYETIIVLFSSSAAVHVSDECHCFHSRRG